MTDKPEEKTAEDHGADSAARTTQHPSNAPDTRDPLTGQVHPAPQDTPDPLTSPDIPDTPEADEVSFEDLLAESDEMIGRELKPGDMVEGTVISIGRHSVFINTGTKSDGVVDRQELLDDNGELICGVGDRLTLYVVSLNESEVILSRAISGAGKAALLEDAARNRTPVEGRVRGVIKGGFHVDILGKRAFCPVSQMDVKYVETPEVFTGQTLHFVITRYEENGRNIVISRRDLLEEQIREAREAFLSTVAAGDVVTGRVTRLMPFGAFIELAPGVEGMAHISELSWSRIEKPDEVVQPDDMVTVKLVKIEAGDGQGPPRIALSMKQAMDDPWESVHARFQVGDQVSGKVVRLTGFGAFVEIAAGVDGLVHVSEMSHTRRVMRPEEEVSVGETVQVVVKSVDLDNRRVSLSIKDALGDPWAGIGVRYPTGQEVEGRVEKRESFGLFISLEPGVTGLMPSSAIRNSPDSRRYESLTPGDTVSVMVREVDEDNRRISLVPPDQKSSDNWREFAGGQGEKPVGTMAHLFEEAMKKKKKQSKT